MNKRAIKTRKLENGKVKEGEGKVGKKDGWKEIGQAQEERRVQVTLNTQEGEVVQSCESAHQRSR
jgi:hypothetical protein